MKFPPCCLAALLALFPAAAWSAEPPAKSSLPTPKFERQVIDAKIQIGYGLAIGDVDGDGKPDILLADKRQIVWYRNGDWKRFVMAENLTPQDDVCIAARDIDGSGKVSVAVGAGWNPGETNDPKKSGAVFYLIRPKDPTQRWTPIPLHHEVTTHRMKWIRTGRKTFQLIVVPLHGHGDRAGRGPGVRILAYDVPQNPRDRWTTHLIDDTMHMTHNFEAFAKPPTASEQIFVAGREGIDEFSRGSTEAAADVWTRRRLLSNSDMKNGAGEVRVCRLPPNFGLATIEPMHGNQVVYYAQRQKPFNRLRSPSDR